MCPTSSSASSHGPSGNDGQSTPRATRVTFAQTTMSTASSSGSIKTGVIRDSPQSKLPFTRSGIIRGLLVGNGPDGRVDDESLTREAKNIFNRITCQADADTMSRLQFIKALQEDRTVAQFVLPGIDCRSLFEDEDSYEAAHFLYNYMSKGRRRVRFEEFLANFQNTKANASNSADLRKIFDLLDVNRDNRISRHELLLVVMRDLTVYDFMLRDADVGPNGDDEEISNAVDDVYKAICGDAKFFDFADFVSYFRSIARIHGCGLHQPVLRSEKRALVIGPGFNVQVNPAQSHLVMQSGFQVHWCHNIPTPEERCPLLLNHVSAIRDCIDRIRPDVLVAASVGGAYLTALWQTGYWRGPTVMINAHPSCRELPADVPIIVAHGDQDGVFHYPRQALESMISTGSPNMCFLYYSSTCGRLPTGHTPRVGDQHQMATLGLYDCLPRLMESVLCPEGPELHMTRTWVDRLLPERLEAEKFLGYTPYKLRQFWVSPTRKTIGPQEMLFDVPQSSLEHRMVEGAFRSSSADPSAYGPAGREQWARMRLLRIQRIENCLQQDGGIQAYYNSVRTSFESMGVEFVPGIHTRWLFHGSRDTNSIIHNPIQGFQPLASGSAGAAVWGRGTYFARDAEYVASGPFCGPPSPDGTRRMLMCLVTTGLSCAGDANHNGILPMRQGTHRYNSSVDALVSPEIFIIQHPGAAYPAYVLTFAC